MTKHRKGGLSAAIRETMERANATKARLKKAQEKVAAEAAEEERRSRLSRWEREREDLEREIEESAARFRARLRDIQEGDDDHV